MAAFGAHTLTEPAPFAAQILRGRKQNRIARHGGPPARGRMGKACYDKLIRPPPGLEPRSSRSTSPGDDAPSLPDSKGRTFSNYSFTDFSQTPVSPRSSSAGDESLSTADCSEAGYTMWSRSTNPPSPNPEPCTTTMFDILGLEPAKPMMTKPSPAPAPAAWEVPQPFALTQEADIADPEPVGFWYSEKNATAEACQQFTFLAGVRVHIVPNLDMPAETSQSIKANMTFVAEPPLPAGLCLDRKTGVITGTPAKGQGQPSVHKIIARVPATCAGGISLGSLPLTSCVIGIQLVDLRDLELTSVMASGGEQQLLIKFRPTK